MRGVTAMLACSLLASACSVGDGVGEASGELHAPACNVDGPFDLDPDFFGAEFFEQGLTITMQRGGDYQVKSDGLLFDIADAHDANDRLGEPLPVRYLPDASLDELSGIVRVSLYLNETCDRDEHAGLVGVDGSVTIESIGNGTIDEADRVEGTFAIEFAEPAGHGATASLEGYFRFRYTRGRPAQRFP